MIVRSYTTDYGLVKINMINFLNYFSIFTWHICMVVKAASWLAGVTPAQQDATTLTGISGKKTVGIAELRLIRKAYEEKLREMNFSGEFHVLLSEKTEQKFLFRTWQEAVGDYE